MWQCCPCVWLQRNQLHHPGAVPTAALVQESGGAAARAELGLGGDHSSSSAGQRERMLSATSKMQQTGDRITQGRQQLLETEVS